MMEVSQLQSLYQYFLEVPLCDIGWHDLPNCVKVEHLTYILKLVPKTLPTWHQLTYAQPLHVLEEGDIIVIDSSLGWLSYAIVSNADPGASRVICFANEDGQPLLDIATLFQEGEVSLQEIPVSRLIAVMKSNVFTLVKQEDKISTLMRALQLLTDGLEFNLLRFNSEHFATLAFRGEAESTQIANLWCHIERHLISGGLAAAGTKEGCKLICQLLSVVHQMQNDVLKLAARTTAKQAVKEGVKQVANEGIKQITKHGTKHAAKHVTKEATKMTSSRIMKEGAKHVAKKAAKQTTTKVVKEGVKQVTKQVTRQATKTVVKEGANQVVKEAVKTTSSTAVKEGVKLVTKEGAKHVTKEGAKHVTKHAAKKVVKEGTMHIVKHVSKEVTKTTTTTAVKEGAKKVTKRAAVSILASEGATAVAKTATAEAAESVVSEGAKQLMKEGSKSAAKETVEGTVSTAASLANRVKDGAKSAAVVGVLVEGAFLSYKLRQSYKQFSKEEISGTQFRHQVMSDVGSSGGSLAGGAAGAAIGTMVFPVVGTFIGGAVGGILGSFVGSKAGEATDHVVFGS